MGRFLTKSLVLFYTIGLASANAKTMIATCSNFEASQTDYIIGSIIPDNDFTFNEFNDYPTKMLSENLTVVWKEGESKAKIKWGEWSKNLLSKDWQNFTFQPKDWQNITLVSDEAAVGEPQLTFVGFIDVAPAMVSIYPDMNVIFLSQHGRSILFKEGSWASNISGKCDIKFK